MSKIQASRLAELPVEVLCMIAANLDNAALKRLRLVSRLFRPIADDYIFNEITLSYQKTSIIQLINIIKHGYARNVHHISLALPTGFGGLPSDYLSLSTASRRVRCSGWREDVVDMINALDIHDKDADRDFLGPLVEQLPHLKSISVKEVEAYEQLMELFDRDMDSDFVHFGIEHRGKVVPIIEYGPYLVDAKRDSTGGAALGLKLTSAPGKEFLAEYLPDQLYTDVFDDKLETLLLHDLDMYSTSMFDILTDICELDTCIDVAFVNVVIIPDPEPEMMVRGSGVPRPDDWGRVHSGLAMLAGAATVPFGAIFEDKMFSASKIRFENLRVIGYEGSFNATAAEFKALLDGPLYYPRSPTDLPSDRQQELVFRAWKLFGGEPVRCACCTLMWEGIEDV